MSASTALRSDAKPERTQVSAARLDELCEFAPETGSRAEVVYWFIQLASWLRPRRGESRTLRAKFFAMQLGRKTEWNDRVARTFTRLVDDSNLAEFFLSAGLPRGFHFFGALRTWIGTRVLPTPCDTREVERVVTLAFRRSDLSWVRTSGIVGIATTLLSDEARARVVAAMGEAMLDLTHQLSAQAHTPTVRELTTQERSPFRGLYECVATFVAIPDDDQALGAVRGRCAQCALAITTMKSGLVERGADLNTTFQLMRMQQQLTRLCALADALHRPTARTSPYFLVGLIRASMRDGRMAHLVDRSTALVVQNLVDTSAEVGRAYLEPSHSSWPAALRAGLGGGVIMAVATVIKFALAALHLPTFWEGLAFSINYAGAFCAAYLLHCTIATKLPANTAATIAQCVQSSVGHRARLTAFVAIWKDMVRLQAGGLVGNILAVVPVALGIDFMVRHWLGHPVLGVEKADHVFAQQSLVGPSLIFAALTGVFLWMSSLIGAASDNWTRVARLEASLATNVWTMRTIGLRRGGVWARAIVERTGGLIGNASLGFLLGGVPAAFAIMGLPVQIRHVTVSSASVALAWGVHSAESPPAALVVAGVALIGIVNLVVSFSLALWLALRPADQATRVVPRALVRIGLKRWLPFGRAAA